MEGPLAEADYTATVIDGAMQNGPKSPSRGILTRQRSFSKRFHAKGASNHIALHRSTMHERGIMATVHYIAALGDVAWQAGDGEAGEAGHCFLIARDR